MCITVNKAVKRVKNFWFYGVFTKNRILYRKNVPSENPLITCRLIYNKKKENKKYKIPAILIIN